MTIWLVAMGVRLAVGVWLGHFSDPQIWEPEVIAQNLLASRGFLLEHLGIPYRAYLMPVYPIFCAAIYLLTDYSRAAVLLVQCAVGAGVCLQVRAIGKYLFEEARIPEIGAWLMALSPPLIFYATRLHPLTLDVAAFLWALWAWIRFFAAPSWSRATHVGVASGLAFLSRGTIGLFLFWAGGCFLWASKGRRQRAILPLVLAGITTCAVVAPWLIRNAFHLKAFPVLISSGAQSFWQGSNPQASGGAHLPDGRTILSTLSAEEEQQLSGLDEMGQSRWFRKKAWNFIQAHPLQALQLFGKKLFFFWWFSPQTGLYYPPAYTEGYRWYYIALLALVACGMWSFWPLLQRQEAFWLIVAFCALVAVAQSLYYVDGRHRWVVEPILLLWAAAGLWALKHPRTCLQAYSSAQQVS